MQSTITTNAPIPAKRPVWLFSMDSDQFYAAPTTTATLKSYYLQHGQECDSQDIELVHFKDADDIDNWQSQHADSLLDKAQQAIDAGVEPILGFSFYTWNAAEFLELVSFFKNELPKLLIIAGGPHVQQAEDYLGHDPIDYIVLGEGEQTFTELLDSKPGEYGNIHGLAYLSDNGDLTKNEERQRIKDLNTIPSPLDVLELTDEDGKPLYESISYETSRGCPYKCAFCEWGTGAIGSKMNQFAMERIHRDWRLIVKSGIKNIWLADSNFGALREDLEKTQLICDLKQEFGLPSTFATSWSKKHNQRTQEMVLLLNQNGLLPHYQLALQTLTPLALELSNRKNMDSNKYERIAKDMATADVPIAAELIWGLPGDNLKDYETNLDILLAIFPNINIFGYTLLPGTEFYEKRDEYQIQTLPVAGYGKAKGEYVIGCHTFDTEEGIEGYFLITAHILLNHGHLLPLTLRHMALEGSVPVSTLLRKVLYTLLDTLKDNLDAYDLGDKMQVYENRDKIYLALFERFEESYAAIESVLLDWLDQHNASETLIQQVKTHIAMDKALCPMPGNKMVRRVDFDADVQTIFKQLHNMELADASAYQIPSSVRIETPGGVGTILLDPDGGSWLKGHLLGPATDVPESIEAIAIPA